jgi:hypothetical protein
MTKESEVDSSRRGFARRMEKEVVVVLEAF